MTDKLTRPPRDAETEEIWQYLEEIWRQLALVGSVTVNVGNITANTISTFTIPVMGARVSGNQQVALGPPSTIEAGLTWCGFVSADDEVTVRVKAHAAGDVNPAEAIWSARVFL